MNVNTDNFCFIKILTYYIRTDTRQYNTKNNVFLIN